VALVTRKPQTQKRLRNSAGAAALLAVTGCMEACGFVHKPHTREPSEAWWMVRWPVDEAARVLLWLSQ
jgi:hypothetical protein